MLRNFAVSVAGVFLTAAAASAAPMLSLSSSADLAHLTPGTPFTVDVLLSGLPSGAALSELSATVKFDQAVFGAPTSITPGLIVPQPLADPLDFLSASAPGLADASFNTFSTSAATQVTSNGVFYHFTLTPQTTGAGDLVVHCS